MHNLKTRTISVVAFLMMTVALVNTTKVEALQFKFSFTNTFGGQGGTVSGTVFGLVDDMSNQTTAQIVLTALPIQYGTINNNQHDTSLWNNQLANVFTVQGGAVTAYEYLTVDVLNGDVDDFVTLNLSKGLGSQIFIEGLSGDTVVDTFNEGVHSDANMAFTLVPEPTTFLLLGIGIAGLAGADVRRRRKRKAVDNS